MGESSIIRATGREVAYGIKALDLTCQIQA